MNDCDAHGLWLTTGEWDAVYKTARAFGFTEASAFVRYCIWIVKQLEGSPATCEALRKSAEDFKLIEAQVVSAISPKPKKETTDDDD